MSHKSIEFFSKYIEKETGIIFQESNLYQLKTRLEEIVMLEKLSSIDELASMFQGIGPKQDLKQRLLDLATNNETLFFRDQSFFAGIQDFILQEIMPLKPFEINIWSAASSTGQEALSIAMVLDELAQKVSLPPVKILATDISEAAVAKAKAGVYSDFEMRRGLSEDRKRKYFTKTSEGWQANRELQSKISYRINNLIRSKVNETFHLILCRNVLIYQKVDMKKVVVESLYRQLGPNGAILLGVGETLLGIRENVETLKIGNVIFYTKNSSRMKSAC